MHLNRTLKGSGGIQIIEVGEVTKGLRDRSSQLVACESTVGDETEERNVKIWKR